MAMTRLSCGWRLRQRVFVPLLIARMEPDRIGDWRLRESARTALQSMTGHRFGRKTADDSHWRKLVAAWRGWYQEHWVEILRGDARRELRRAQTWEKTCAKP